MITNKKMNQKNNNPYEENQEKRMEDSCGQ